MVDGQALELEGNVQLSHLMFVDDLLLFGKSTTKQLACVRDVLNKLCYMSGKWVRMTRLGSSSKKNTLIHVRKELVYMFGYKETRELGIYLGVPLTWRSPKHKDFNHIVDNIMSKVTSQKAQHLSFAGKPMLAKMVI